MKNLINKTFVENYLTCGATYDNYIFERCPKDVMLFAGKFSKKTQNDKCKAVNLCFTPADKVFVDKLVDNFKDEYRKKIIAGSYFNLKFMLGIIGTFGDEKCKFKKETLINVIKDFSSTSVDDILNAYLKAPLSFDIDVAVKKIPKFELNIFCFSKQNIYLQMAMNDYISYRLPYSIKLFTDSERLCTYFTSTGGFMQAPHDYLSMDINKFMEREVEEQKK